VLASEANGAPFMNEDAEELVGAPALVAML
jgi:hypothetical protein